MVLRVDDGSKTQTRRLLNPQPTIERNGLISHAKLAGHFGAHVFGPCFVSLVACPYGKPGDRLWVRESIRHVSNGARYAADNAPVKKLDRWRWQRDVLPGIHMPRSLCRFVLEVLSVRVQRLQDISLEDAIAEGARPFEGLADPSPYPRSENRWSMVSPRSHRQCLGSPQMAFANYFNVVHAGENWNLKPGPSPWDANPFVYAVTFRKVAA